MGQMVLQAPSQVHPQVEVVRVHRGVHHGQVLHRYIILEDSLRVFSDHWSKMMRHFFSCQSSGILRLAAIVFLEHTIVLPEKRGLQTLAHSYQGHF